MTTCSLDIKDLITAAVERDLTKSPHTNGMKLGEVYPFDPDTVSALDTINTSRGVRTYLIRDSGTNIQLILDIPTSTIDSYLSTAANPKARTQHQIDNRHDELFNQTNIEGQLETLIGQREKDLNRFMESMLIASKQILINMKKRAGGDNVDVEALSDVIARVTSDPNRSSKIRTMVRFLSEAAEVTKDRLKIAKGIVQNSTPATLEADFHLLSDILGEVSMYGTIVREFYDFMAGSSDNQLKKAVTQANESFREIESIYAQMAKEVSLDKLESTTKDGYQRALAEHEQEVRRLTELKQGKPSSEQLRIDKKIAKLKEKFAKLAPTRDNLESHLTGSQGDSSAINKFFMAGVTNPDLLIQGFSKLVKDTMLRASRKARAQLTEIGALYQELLKTGFDDSNVDEAFKELYVDVTVWKYDEPTDSLIEYQMKFFDSEVDQNWRTEFSRMQAEMAQLNIQLRKLRRSADANTPESQARIKELENQITLKGKESYQWRRDNFEGEYNEEYQDVQDILQQTFNVNGTVVSLQDLKDQYISKISDIQDTIDAMGGVPTENDILEMSEARKQWETMRTTEGKVPGSVEYQIAEALTNYNERMRDMTESFTISPNKLERFYRKKGEIDQKYEEGLITQEERDRWYAANTTVTYDPKYWTRRKQVVEKMATLSQKLAELSGNDKEVDLADKYLELEKICKKYRDYNSFIDGRKLTEEETQAVLDLEHEIELIKQNGRVAFAGFLGDDFKAEYNDLQVFKDVVSQELLDVMKADPSKSRVTQEKIAELRATLREFKKTEDSLVDKHLELLGLDQDQSRIFKALYGEFEETIRELSGLTESRFTDYYYDTYNAELRKFVAGIPESDKREIMNQDEVRVNGKNYIKVESGLFHLQNRDGSLSFDDVYSGEEILDFLFEEDFKQSDWYLANHFDSERWDRNSKTFVYQQVPIYSWRISEPSNKTYIKKADPNTNWKRRKIKEEFKNPNKKIELDGYPTIKRDRWTNPKYFEKRNNNSNLWAFRDRLIDKYLSAQESYDAGDRLGLAVPSIEKDLAAYTLLQSPGSAGTLAKTKAKRAVTFTDQDVDEGLYRASDEAGFEKRVIPVMFRGRMDANLVSQNIVETIGKYVGAAEVYTARKELAVQGRAVETTLEYQAHTPNSNFMSKIGRWFGLEKYLKKKGVNQRLDNVRSIINMHVYGEMVSEETDRGKMLHKFVSNSLGVRAMSIFAFTGLAQGVNLVGGMIQQLIKTQIRSGNARFTFSDWAWAQKEFIMNSGSFTRDVGKVGATSFWTQFAEFFDINDLDMLDNFGEQIYEKGLFRQLRVDRLAFIKNIVEHELFMTTVMAYARNNHVETTSGERIALKDAFEMVGGILQPKADVNLPDSEIERIKNNLSSLLRDINGNYAKLDKTLIETYWFGKALLFMKKWLIPLIVHRWGMSKYSVEQDKIIQGFYLTSFNYLRETLTSGNPQALVSLLYTPLDPTMSDQQRDAINRTKIEIMLLVGMSLMVKYMLGYDDDDEDRYKELKKQHPIIRGLVYTFVKAQSENSMYFPLAGIAEAQKTKNKILTNIIPYSDTFLDILKKDFNFGAATDWGEDFLVKYKTNTPLHKKGDLRIVSDMMKLMGKTTAKSDAVEALREFEGTLKK